MKQKLLNQVKKLRGSTLVKLNRLFHAFFLLSKLELRATEKMCRTAQVYEYVEIERYK